MLIPCVYLYKPHDPADAAMLQGSKCLVVCVCGTADLAHSSTVPRCKQCGVAKHAFYMCLLHVYICI